MRRSLLEIVHPVVVAGSLSVSHQTLSLIWERESMHCYLKVLQPYKEKYVFLRMYVNYNL